MDKHKTGVRPGFANFFGVLGYLVVVLQWALAVLVYLPWLYETFFKPTHVAQPDPTPPPIVPADQAAGEPSILLIIFGFIVTALMIALALYAMIKTPAMLVKASRKVVQTAAEQATPVVLQVQHRKDTPRNRLKLTPRLIVIFKLAIIIVPLVLALTSQLVPLQKLDIELVRLLALWMAGVSILLFVLQYGIAWVLKVHRTALR